MAFLIYSLLQTAAAVAVVAFNGPPLSRVLLLFLQSVAMETKSATGSHSIDARDHWDDVRYETRRDSLINRLSFPFPLEGNDPVVWRLNTTTTTKDADTLTTVKSKR